LPDVKVVLFAGGQGTRLRDYSETIPKPLVEVGNRPIIWHLMKYYAHYGHCDFILCLGHGSRLIKDYFVHYDECATNDFVLSDGGRNVELLSTDIQDWRITFVDTGASSLIGERLRRVRHLLADEEVFLANYSDGLSDLPLDRYVDEVTATDSVASFISVPAPHTFHIVHADTTNHVERLEHVGSSKVRINAGFFVLRREIFDHLNPGDELVLEPFQRLIAQRRLLAIPYDGFWQNMDTFKDKMVLDELAAQPSPPWQVWRS
jgi:glucose-1-phosphate cytidylyltransferase